MQNNRNADVLRRIISYCNDISEAIQRFGKDYAVFAEDSVYKNAMALCVLQIGEYLYWNSLDTNQGLT